ncbi:MAG: peptidoglycan-binding protein [Oscillospiraceae bacterium]|nr:peptidoglycan-binding protein [Oscillospiraceae bacterium]
MTDAAIPYIPDTITVHLAAPNVPAENVTVPFLEYLKNVASSEIYPTWDEAALRANILAQASFALNKIYLEYYPSRGYDFDITSSTAFDQKYIHGRDTFDNVSAIVDDLFGTYIRRRGTIEPLASSFCNGTTVTCSGMSQWGSQALAEQGYSSVDILRYYYGDDIELVTNAPVQSPRPSYPGTPLQLGSSGESVLQLQYSLNRIAQNYPAIPKITPVDGLFGPGTDSAVRAFQRIFSLTPDGIVGKATWYQIVAIYVAVTRLAELNSEGQRYLFGEFNPPNVLSLGSSGEYVSKLQYMLQVLSEFIPEIPYVPIDGQYGVKTRDAVLAFQRFAGLTPSGITGSATWSAIHNRFAGITGTVLDNIPVPASTGTVSTISDVQRSLQNVAPVFASLSPPRVTGMMDRSTSLAISKLQTQLGLRPTGQITQEVLRYLTILSNGQLESTRVRHRQYPGYALSTGQRDPVSGKEASV